MQTRTHRTEKGLLPCLAAGLLMGGGLLGCGGPGEEQANQETPPEEVRVSGDLSSLFIDDLPEGYEADRFIPEDNAITAAKVSLGMQLYFDGRLSADGTVSCATCHDPALHFTDARPTSTGINGQVGGRNAPTVINATYMYLQFWDGRAGSLEEQALGPIENPIEMGSDHETLVRTLSEIPGYAQQFQEIFGRPVHKEDVGRAIAAFERTVLSGDSAWDRYNRGEKEALGEQARRGWELFSGKANCSKCHAGFNLSDSDFHNLGVGMDLPEPDPGRLAVTGDEQDTGAFKTPTLRDIQHTAPYMHDGSQATLEEVIDWYDQGGHPNPWLDEEMVPLQLSETEKAELLAFLKALDGAATPIGLTAPPLPE